MSFFFLSEVSGQRTSYALNQDLEKPEGNIQNLPNTGSVKIAESFEIWPPAGWTFASPDGGKGWAKTSIAKTPLYKGGNYAAYAYYYSGGTTYNDQWIISPAFTVSSGEYLSFWMEVLESVNYKDKVEVRISTSGNKTPDFSTILETINIPSGKDIPWTWHTYDLSAYSGKTIYIAIRETVTDNKNEGAVVMIDLFQVGTLPQTDIALSEITTPKYNAPVYTDISCKVLNLGKKTINSFTINYQIDQGTSYFFPLSEFSLSPGSEFGFTCTNKDNLHSGKHNIKMWITQIDGTEVDEVAENNSLTKNIYVASQATTNFPLFEEFTSSTCGPCANFNTNILNPFIDLHINEISLIKYQMSWPPPGDPYYTAEGGTRRNFYGVNSVPTLYIGGIEAKNTTEYLNQTLTKEKGKLAFFSLKMDSKITGPTKIIEVNATVTPYVTSTDFVIHFAVIEKETTQNAATNGEKKFRQVLMKMLPDAAGTMMNCVENSPLNFNFTADLSGTKTEQFTDLAVVAFIQNIENKEIYQSALNMTVGINDRNLPRDLETTIYPNPFSDQVKINIHSSESATLSVAVISLDGRKVKQLTYNEKIVGGIHTISWDGKNDQGQSESSGFYILRIKTDKFELNRKIILK
jgi:hypothetical protein